MPFLPCVKGYDNLGRIDADRFQDPNWAMKIDASATLLQFVEAFLRRLARFDWRIGDLHTRSEIFGNSTFIEQISCSALAEPRRADGKAQLVLVSNHQAIELATIEYLPGTAQVNDRSVVRLSGERQEAACV